MHVYQMRSSNKNVVAATEQRLQICMATLKEVSKVWLVAKMVHTLFESILGNKSLEERLQKAAGKRHRKPQPITVKPREEVSKRKFDEMDLGFTNGPPAPPVSYERSRPQTPALTPSHEAHGPATNGNTLQPGSPQINRQHLGDNFPPAGHSRGNTRPTTPFNPNFSYPGTPPELFLVTRNSPNIPSDLWQNFQPDQLFPENTNLSMPFASSVSPIQQHSLVDPQLGGQANPMLQANPGTPVLQGHGLMATTLAPHGTDPGAWASMDGIANQAVSNDDAWSNSSKGGPIVPATLNVEDWYEWL